MVLALFCATSATLLHAQGGTVSGRVTSGELRPLSGVAVQVQGTGRADMTNEAGEFTISNVPAGNHTIEASRLGYTTTTSRAQVAAGGTVRVTLTLRESAVVLEGVTVSPIREGQARALEQQKNADNIVSVISADAVGNFPDANVADALKRVSGIGLVRFRGEGVAVNIRGAPPEMSAIAINGVNMPSGSTERDANLNVLSTDLIGALEVNKALTPDMDADAIGGRVNIVTKGALDAGKRRIRISPQLGYYDLGNVRNNTNGSATFGDVFNVGGNMLGVMLSGSHSVVARDMDNLENTFSGTPVSGFRPSGFTVKAYDITRTRYSGTARLDYAIGDQTHFFLSASDARLHNAEIRNTASIHWPSYASSTTGVISNSGAATFAPGSDIHQGVNTSTSSRLNFIDRLNITDTRSLSGGGRHTFGRVTWDYTGSVSYAQQEAPPGRKYIAYRTPTSGAGVQTVKYDFSNPAFPKFTRLDRSTGAPVDGLLHPDLSLYNFFEFNEQYDLTRDRTQGFVSNVTVPYTVAGLDASFQVGGKYNYREKDRVRTFTQSLQATRAEPTAPKLTELLRGRQMNNFGRYALGPAFDTRTVHQLAGDQDLIKNETNIPASEAPNAYIVDEAIYAAYAMSTLNIGALRLLAGLRAEQTALTGSGKVSTDGWKTITDLTNERTFNHVFPSLHAKYELPTGTILRAAVTSGINRPKFTNIRPSGNLIENEVLSTFSGSNPDIKPTTARSYDLMAEHYFPLGIVSGGLFVKQLKNVVFRTIRDGTADDFFVGQSLEGFRITRDDNGPDGVIRGAEINLDRAFTFLPGLLSGLGMMTNYTYTFSEATTPTGGKSTLANQPSKVVNASAYYEKHGLSLRLTYNWQNDYVETIGEADWQSLRVAPRGIYDLTTSFKVNRNASVFLEGSNLGNSIQEKYYGKYSEGRIFEVERFGRQVWTGVRLNF